MKAEDLKNSILQLAMEGKLVPQDSNDEPASVLLERIREEKEKLIKEKKISRNNKESFIFRKNGHFYEKIGKNGEPICIDNEIPFDIPDTWSWYRLDEIGVYKKGPFGSALKKSIFVPKSNDAIKVYEQKNAIQKDNALGEYYITKEYYDSKMKGFTVEPGDIIVSCAGTIGETYVLPENIELGIINQALMRMNIVPTINLDYFLIYFDHILKKSAIENSKGSAIKNIPPFKIFKKLLFPFPPLNEQKRIVNEINKLNPLINEYDTNKKKLDKLDSEFSEKLKSSILQEAIQGKLVPQNPNDEPASILLKKIKDEKERLIKEKKIKRNKNESFIYKKNGHFYEKIGKKCEPVCIDDEIPFDIPNNWEWARIKNISELVTKGTTPKGGKSAYKDTGIKFLRVENIGKNGEINLINIKYIDKEVHENFLKRSILKENDLLISIAGALGRTAIVPNNILPLNANQAISLVRWFNTDLIYVPFIEKSINSPAIQKLLLKQSKVTAIPNLTLEIIRECLVPIPPLNEQIKIVKRIENLLNLIYS